LTLVDGGLSGLNQKHRSLKMLNLNKTKTCFWEKVCPGKYTLGDITVKQVWETDGPCKNSHMWHVIIDGKTFIKWTYLKDARKTAIKLDRLVNGD
jgi:hypothetical protein